MNPKIQPEPKKNGIDLPPLLDELVVEDKGDSIRVGDILLPKRKINGQISPGIPEDIVLTPFDIQRWLVIAEAIAKNRPTLIQGGAGTGKTYAVTSLAAALNYPCYVVNCATTPIEDIIGKPWPTQDRKNYPSGFCFRPGPAYLALRDGGILCFDEWNFAKEDIRARLHSFFDTALSPGSAVTILENEGETFVPHPDFRMLGLQNPPGEEFLGRRALDEPQYGRWTFVNEPLDMPREDKLLHWQGCMAQLFEPACVEGNKELVQTGGQFIDACVAITKMIEEEKIADGEGQKPYVTFRRELAKIKSWMADRREVEFVKNLKDAMWREILRKFRNQDRKTVWTELDKVDYSGTALLPRKGGGPAKRVWSAPRAAQSVAAKPVRGSLAMGPRPAATPASNRWQNEDERLNKLRQKLNPQWIDSLRKTLSDLGI